MIETIAKSPRPRGERHLKDSVLEVAVFGVVLTVPVVALFYWASKGNALDTWFQMVSAGREVLKHIGWAFGVYVPTLLGFYAIVLSKQWVSGRGDADGTRRMLGIVSQILAAALFPPVLLVVAFSLENPDTVGVLLVLMPATGVTIFLAAQLGIFNVLPLEKQREQAQKTLGWATTRLQSFADTPARSMWLILVFNTGIASVAAMGAVLIAAIWWPIPVQVSLFKLLLSYFLISSITVALGLGWVYFPAAARDVIDGILARISAVSLFLYLTAAMLLAFSTSEHEHSLQFGLLVAMSITVASTFFRCRCLAGLSIRELGEGVAKKRVARVYWLFTKESGSVV